MEMVRQTIQVAAKESAAGPMTRFQQAPPSVAVRRHRSLPAHRLCARHVYTPLGVTLWVLYLIPLVLAYLVWFPVGADRPWQEP